MESISLTRALTDGEPEPAKERGIRFVIASDARARDGHRIDLSGMDTRGFAKNPVMLFAHDSRSLPLGTWSDLELVEGKTRKLRAVADFVSGDLNPFADVVRKLVEAKVVRMASIAWRTISAIRDPELKEDQYGLLFTRTELLEASIVPIGADPLAVSGARALIGADALADVRSWIDASIALWPSEFGHRDDLFSFRRAVAEPVVSVISDDEVARIAAAVAARLVPIVEPTQTPASIIVPSVPSVQPSPIPTVRYVFSEEK